MVNGGNRDGGRLDFAVGGDELFQGSEGAASEFAADGVGAADVTVDDAQQTDRFALVLELSVDAGVVAAERAHADHCDVNGARSSGRRSQGAGCRRLPIV